MVISQLLRYGNEWAVFDGRCLHKCPESGSQMQRIRPWPKQPIKLTIINLILEAAPHLSRRLNKIKNILARL